MPKASRSTAKSQTEKTADSHAAMRRVGRTKEELRESLYSYTKQIDDHLKDFYERFHQQSQHNVDTVKLELDVIKLALRKEIVDAILD